MSQNDLTELSVAMNKGFADIGKHLESQDKRFDTIDERLSGHDERFNDHDKRFDEVLAAMSHFADDVSRGFQTIRSDFADLKASHDRLLNTIDGFISRIDKYETELIARDHEIQRLKKWIKEIADHTGVELTI